MIYLWAYRITTKGKDNAHHIGMFTSGYDIFEGQTEDNVANVICKIADVKDIPIDKIKGYGMAQADDGLLEEIALEIAHQKDWLNAQGSLLRLRNLGPVPEPESNSGSGDGEVPGRTDP